MKRHGLTLSEAVQAFKAGLQPPFDLEDDLISKYPKGSKVYVRSIDMEGYITGMILRHDPFNVFIKVKTPYCETLYYPDELEVLNNG